MIETNDSSFKTEVIEKSKQIPVLVDFWAPWCMPCKMLAPVLEKAEKDFAGKFLLVEVNTDENQELAATYEIMSIPSVKLFKGGAVSDEFVGMLGEADLKKFLNKNL